MDEKDWSSLITIFDEKSLTRAAKKLYISQPSLTYRIRELERELNIKIFVKGKGVVKFTKEGQLIAEYSKKMLLELNKLKEELCKISQPNTGILNITAGETFGHTELPDILSSFRELYPDIKFNVSSINPNNLLDSLVNADSHITIVRSDVDWNGPKLLLRKDPIYLISKMPITLKDLPKLPRINFILTTSTKKAIADWWQESFNQLPLIGMSVNRSETCLEMVRQRFGYAIAPLYLPQIKKLETELSLQPLRHNDDTLYEINLFAYYREEIAEIKIVKTFIKFLQQYFTAQNS